MAVLPSNDWMEKLWFLSNACQKPSSTNHKGQGPGIGGGMLGAGRNVVVVMGSER